MIGTIHPFPARMAPELALDSLIDLRVGSCVLDPMSGSGTVLRQAAELGLRARGFDMDPLAVLMSRVWNTYVPDDLIASVGSSIVQSAQSLSDAEVVLPWIDESEETRNFVDYWFGPTQRVDLRKLAFSLHAFETGRYRAEKHAAADVVRVALSRIIITKDRGASLARDVSHSRPHKVATSSDYDVFEGVERSLQQVRKRLLAHPPWGGAEVELGDARALSSVQNGSVDAVLTSPPYLNAIDYMRGHRLSLVWLGYGLEELRTIRSDSVGAERGPNHLNVEAFAEIESAMSSEPLPPRHTAMVRRYAEDVYRLLSETARVLKRGGEATYVVGNSCLRGVFIRNSAGIQAAARMVGLQEISTSERQLPEQSRYLPLTSPTLGKRMRTETILQFSRR